MSLRSVTPTQNNMQYCSLESVYRFKTHYVRNNRRSTEKNLRCFPCCNADGHVTQGFCGSGCKFRLTLNSPTSSQPTTISRNALSCVVELTMCDEIPVSVPVVGQTYNANEIWSRLKAGKPEPWTRPYWKGVPEKSTQQMDVVDFIFTPTHWHYGWRSNKHTNKSRHTCRMHAFAEMSDGMLLCIASTSEGAFTISSTKKRQPEIPPGESSAPVGPNALPGYGKSSAGGRKRKKRRKTGDALNAKNTRNSRAPPLQGQDTRDSSSGKMLDQKEHRGKKSASSLSSTNNSSSSSSCSSSCSSDITVQGISEALQALSSIGIPSQFTSDENSWNEKRRNEEDDDRNQIRSMDVDSFGGTSFDMMGPEENSSSLKREELDKFSFDADILDSYTNIETTAAAATSSEGQERARARSTSKSKSDAMDIDDDDDDDEDMSSVGLPSDSGGVTSSSSTSSNPGSVSPVTSAQGGNRQPSLSAANAAAAAATAASAPASESEPTMFVPNEKQLSFSHGPGVHRPPMRSMSSRSSIQSNGSANSFLGAFDSFEGDEANDAVNEEIQQEDAELSTALDEALFIPDNVGREESESFMTFDKVDEERLQSGSVGSLPASPMATPPKVVLVSQSKGVKSTPLLMVHGTGGNKSGVVRAPLIQAGRNNNHETKRNDRSKSGRISANAPIITTTVGAEGERDARGATATAVGVQMSFDDRSTPTVDSFTSWMRNNWKSPRFVCFVFGVLLSLTFIIICFVMLIGNNSSSSSDDTDTGGAAVDGGETSRRVLLLRMLRG